MLVKKRNLSLLNNMISGIGIITLGIIVTVLSIETYAKVINLLSIIFIVYGISKLINYMLNHKINRNSSTFIGIIVNIVLGFIILFFPRVQLSILPIIFSLYLLLNSVIKMVNYIILKEINLKLRFKELFLAF